MKEIQINGMGEKNELVINYINSIDHFYENNSIEQSLIVLYNEPLKNGYHLFNSLYEKDYPIGYFFDNMTDTEKNKTIESYLSGNTRLCLCTETTENELLTLLNHNSMDFDRITHRIVLN